MQIIVVGNVLIKKMIVNRYRDKLSLDVFYNINEKIMEEMMNVFYIIRLILGIMVTFK